MKLPIAFAILDEVKDEILKPVNLLEVKNLEFRKIDTLRYPIWDIKDLVLQKSDLGIVVNTANEVAIEKFKQNKINFLDISKIIINAVKKFENIKINSIDDIFEIKKEVKAFCEIN